MSGPDPGPVSQDAAEAFSELVIEAYRVLMGLTPDDDVVWKLAVHNNGTLQMTLRQDPDQHA